VSGVLHGQVSDFVVVLLTEVGAISNARVTAEEPDFHTFVLFLLKSIISLIFLQLSYLSHHFVFMLEAALVPSDGVYFLRFRVYKRFVCPKVSQAGILPQV
jgi:hypothetical protein